MSNRGPTILWPIDYSSMTSISHWCIDYSAMTHRLLIDFYTACTRKTLSLLSCTLLFRLWFFYLCQMHFSSCLKFLLTMSRHKVLITNTDDSQNTGKRSAVTQIKILWISALQEKENELLHRPQIGGRNFRFCRKWPVRPRLRASSLFMGRN